MHRAHDQFRAIPELEELSQSVIEMTQLILEEMAQNLAMLPCGGSHGQGKLLPEPKSTSRADIYLAALDRRIDQLVKHLAVLPDSNINLSMLHELETHVQETMDEIWALRNDAWQVVMKQVRNHLAKNGEFRAIVEENKVLFLQTPPKEVIELIIMAGNSNDAEVLRASVDKRKQRRIQGIRMVTKRFDEDPDFRKLLLHGPGGMDLTARIKLLPDMLDRQTEEGDRFITEVLFMLQWHFSKQKEMDSNSQPIDRAARQDNPQG
ncbi:hypothetical protein M406DRAFT_328413 [Cryphonectria parasitica EP155]|uniref:Uncharacterized protein n=1 Tax=Cryphonectria parasitica (strain ATCC 38755 / EP155) TaxID=660469 RepID=A0A9P5CQA9_CRYP1|nr:uncharacterized protein M406DRAFT_328413 [Cryphonectria parasitica EP155]KAF3767329.1 hypothetical protein M406DRAFT_328413 [Cryphonectria parasitica EP155]